MKTRSSPSHAILISLAAGLIMISNSPARAGDAICLCFEAKELKAEIRFVREMAAMWGVDNAMIIYSAERSYASNKLTAKLEYETFAPYDTFVTAGLYESPLYPEKGLYCWHGFWYMDDPQHPSTSVENLTDDQAAACVAEMAEAFAKVIKDEVD